jgi:acetyltransferase-like isoleucine patch superfamily enzyme
VTRVPRWQQARAAPWKAGLEVRRYLVLPLVRAYFAWHGVAWQEGWRVYGLPLLQRFRGSTIDIGTHLQMRSWFGSNPLGVSHRCLLATRRAGASITLGEYVGLTGTVLCAETSISIGNRVRFGANCTVVDTDFHPLDVAQRLRAPTTGATAPVVIEDDVFIGMSALILKGTTIGRGSVIGAGSVVATDIPAGVIAAGNPARVLRPLAPGDSG